MTAHRRFGHGVPLLAALLTCGLLAPAVSRAGGCLEDIYEPNDVCAIATPVAIGNYSGLVDFQGNDDWYKISVPRNATLTVTLTFVHANGDIDMRLFSGPCPGVQVGISNGITNTETITYKNTNGTNNFFVRVYMASGFCNSYSMSLGITGADNIIAGDTPPGWSGPIAPRSDATATLASAIQSTTLPGNTNSTWLNWSIHLVGPDNVPAFDSAEFLDDSLYGSGTISDNSAPNYWRSLNIGPFSIRGGRHTLRTVADPGDQLFETNEGDNTVTSQLVWSPLAATYASPNVRMVPPPRGVLPLPNEDGATFTRQSGVAWCVSEAPRNTDDDYDLLVYDDYTNATSGFSHEIGRSQLSDNATDYVVGHYSGTPLTVDPAVIRFSVSGGSGDFALDQVDARNRNGNLITTNAFSWTPITLPADRLADVYEANLSSGVTYYFSLRRLTGTAPIAFEIFPGTAGVVYGRGGGTQSDATGTLRTKVFTATTTGWHPIVVYRLSGTAANTPLSYDFEWSKTGLVTVPPGEGMTLSFAGALPNPVRERTSFGFTLSRPGPARLSIFDLGGRLVRVLGDGSWSAGPHQLEWNVRDDHGEPAAGGIYWARLEAEGRMLTRRMVLLP